MTIQTLLAQPRPGMANDGYTSLDDIPLRDLTEEQFLVRYRTYRFTASILASRMRYVVKHMSTVVLTTSFSMILRDWYDFAVTISGPREMNYPMSTGSDSLSIFMFTMPEGIRNTIEEYGPENIRPGDVIIANDPYRIGLHVNDVSFIRPVFYRGKVISFVTVRAHQLDMGGVVPGGFSGTKQNVYETGLVIPPTLLYRDDKPVRSAFQFILDTARYGDLRLPDIKALYQRLLPGQRLLPDGDPDLDRRHRSADGDDHRRPGDGRDGRPGRHHVRHHLVGARDHLLAVQRPAAAVLGGRRGHLQPGRGRPAPGRQHLRGVRP